MALAVETAVEQVRDYLDYCNWCWCVDHQSTKRVMLIVCARLWLGWPANTKQLLGATLLKCDAKFPKCVTQPHTHMLSFFHSFIRLFVLALRAAVVCQTRC